MASAPQNQMASYLPVVAIRLDRMNYTFWRYQVLATIRAHGYDDLISPFVAPPPQFISNADHERQLNPDFQTWSRRDQFLLSWMVGSISETMIGHITRCHSARDLWLTLESLFHSQSKARVMQLRLQLQTQKKGDLTIDDYFLKMRGFADSLAAVGKPVDDDDLIMHILASFGTDYDAVVCNLTHRSDVSIQEVQFALQAHEIRLQNHQSALPPSAHYAQSNNHPGYQNRGRSAPFPPFDNPFGRGAAGRGRGGRGPGRDTKIVCQLCGKNGHVALKCFKRFDVHFTGSTAPSPQAYFIDFSHDASQEDAYYAALDLEGQWYADSGATAHVTNDVSKIQSGSVYPGSDQLTVGNGYPDTQGLDEGGAGQGSLPA